MDSVLYVIAKGGTPKAAAAGKGASEGIALLAVLGGTPPKKVTVNEFTTIASVWTSAQFLKGDVLSGTALGLRIAAGNVPNYVNLETGGYGDTIQDVQWKQHSSPGVTASTLRRSRRMVGLTSNTEVAPPAFSKYWTRRRWASLISGATGNISASATSALTTRSPSS